MGVNLTSDSQKPGGSTMNVSQLLAVGVVIVSVSFTADGLLP
jgi:hypothetical protein